MRTKRLAALLASGALSLATTEGKADTFNAWHSDLPLLGSTPSIHAAMAMGAYGFGAWQPADTNWRNIMMNECERLSQGNRASGKTQVIWYAGTYRECNPEAITTLVRSGSTVAGTTLALPGQNWVHVSFKASDGAQAHNAAVGAMINHHTPVVLHLYANWDHWATISQVTANKVDGLWEIDNVWLYDGVQSNDLAGIPTLFRKNLDFSTLGATYWYAMRFPTNPVCSGPVTCPAGFSDPWNRKYTFLYEPPVGTPLTGAPDTAFQTRAAVSPGVTSPGERMTAELASRRALDALRYARATNQRDTAIALANTYAGEAVLVRGTYPSGAPWNYYLVPMLKQSGGANALVMLSAENGAFQEIALPDHTLPYQPVNESRAREAALSMIKPGEQLSAGVLSWNPEYMNTQAHSPYLPYFEFAATNGSGHEVARIRISHNGGRKLSRDDVSQSNGK